MVGVGARWGLLVRSVPGPNFFQTEAYAALTHLPSFCELVKPRVITVNHYVIEYEHFAQVSQAKTRQEASHRIIHMHQ